MHVTYDPSDAGFSQTIVYNPNNADNGYVVQGDNLQSTEPQIIAFDWDANTSTTRFFLDGREYGTAPRLNPASGAITSDLDQFVLGEDESVVSNAWDGRIAEVFTYQSTKTESEMARIFSYLAIKYGITLSGGTANYVNSSGNVIWDVASHVGYNNDIAVI